MLALAGPAAADHRPPTAGDLGLAWLVCRDQAAAVALAERRHNRHLFMGTLFRALTEGACRAFDDPNPVELIEKIAGPFADGDGARSEVWAARGHVLARVYVFVAVAPEVTIERREQ